MIEHLSLDAVVDVIASDTMSSKRDDKESVFFF